MQVDTFPVSEPRRNKKHDFHTISTSKNIAKEKPLYINQEFSKEDLKNDLKANLNTNNSSSKTKKVKNSLNSLLFATLLPTSIVYPNVLDYICNNTGTRNDTLKKKNSKKNKKFWTTIRKKKISELNFDDKIISSSILSPNYATPSPSTPKEIDFKNEESKKTDDNPSQPSQPLQPPDNNKSEPINKENNITPPSTTPPKEESSKPQEPKEESSKPHEPKENNQENKNKNIPKNENIPKDNILASKPPLISKNISKSNPSLCQSNISMNKSHISKINNNSSYKESLPFLSTIGLEDNKKSLSIRSMKKNLSSSVTNINTNVHSKEFKGFKSYTNLSVDDDNKSVMYCISPTLTHGELYKKMDTQNSTFSEQISSLKNTYIITRHNSIDAKKDKNKRNSLIKKSNESVTSSNKQNPLAKSNRSSVVQFTPPNNNNVSINVISDSKSERLNSFPNLDTIKNISAHNLQSSNEGSEIMSENSINTITKANFNNVYADDTTKEIEKLKDMIAESTDKFFSLDNFESSESIEQSQYFEAKTNNNYSIGSLSAIPNKKTTKTIPESKLKNATLIDDDNLSFSSESNEEISVTPKNDSKSKLADIPKSTFSSFEFEDDDNDFSGPLLTLPEVNSSTFSQNYLNNIKQNNYSSTLNIDEDDFFTPSTDRKPTNLEKLQSLFTNDDSSIETKTGGMKNNQSASLSKVANDYLNTMCDFETWDDDFDGDFSIPDTVVNSQKILKQEIISFKSFAVNIEDIKTVYNNIYQLKDKASINSCSSIQNSVKYLEEKYTNCIEKYEVLIDLAEQDENDDDSKVSTRLPFERYITVLEELLNDNSKESKSELDSEKIFSKDGNNINKNYIFGINMLPVLLNNIEPIRTQLKEYYLELSNLLLNSE